MSHEASGGLPEFKFHLGMPQTYSHSKVAEHVIWPLIDSMWHDDWRKNSYVGNDMMIGRRDVIDGQSMEVTVNAFTGMEELDEDALDKDRAVISEAVLDIHELVADHRRGIILNTAAFQDEYIWQHDEEDLITKVSSTYKFDSNNDLEIERDQIVETVDGKSVWYIETSNLEMPEINENDPATAVIQVMSSQLFEHDMEMLETGLYVFNAPNVILKALEKIKEKPITRNC